MNLVIDANILFAALIKDSHIRHFLLFSNHSFYTPEFVFDEINEHIDEIKDKTKLSESEIKEIFNNIILLGNVNIIPLEELEQYKYEAIKISPDPDDIHYIALALKNKCPIWSNDKALKEKQTIIKVYNSEEILNI